MKRILLSLAIWMPLVAYSQINSVYSDDQFSISRIYAGIYSTTTFPVDSLLSEASVNFRLGVKSQLALSESLMVKAWGAMHIEKNQPVAGFNSFELMYKPFQKWSLHAGLIATPTTVLRPNPTTWESQVETNAQNTIVPGRLGSKISYTIAPESSITYGFFNHGEQWAHHLNFSSMAWQLSAYLLDNGDFFTALVYKKDWLESTTTYLEGQNVASSALLNFKDGISLLLDGRYQLDQKEIGFIQTGLRKYINAPTAHLSGFFGLSYDWNLQLIQGQVFIHLS